MDSAKPEVVIVGGGFGGLYAARSLRYAPVNVTLVDRRNFHLFQPLLYQVATGGLSPANIAAPLRGILKRQTNTRVLLAEVVGIDPKAQQIVLTDGTLHYDYLIVAAGATHTYFGHDEWEPLAPGLKTIEDATEIRRRVLYAFEMAERTSDAALRAKWMTFVVVGGGPTGVEMAGAIAELARHTLVRNFRAIDPANTRVVLLEGSPRVLGAFDQRLSEKAKTALARMGVEVMLDTSVTRIQPHLVTLKNTSSESELAAATVIWAAGVKASPLGGLLARATGANIDRAGRLQVLPDLSLPGAPNVFAIGDMVALKQADGTPVPGVAPAAMQMGSYVARRINDLIGNRPTEAFRYRDKGSMATIGRSQAVVQTMGLRFSGFFAWFVWLFIHIFYIIQFENRVLILFQWFWNYVTRNRAARLITNVSANGEPTSDLREGVRELKKSG